MTVWAQEKREKKRYPMKVSMTPRGRGFMSSELPKSPHFDVSMPQTNQGSSLGPSHSRTGLSGSAGIGACSNDPGARNPESHVDSLKREWASGEEREKHQAMSPPGSRPKTRSGNKKLMARRWRCRLGAKKVARAVPNTA
jgi:hypothetical protein